MLRITLMVVASLAAWACSGDFPHQSPYDPDSPGHLQAKAQLTGTVQLEGEAYQGAVTVALEGDRAYLVETGPEGSFTVSDVQPGAYKLRIGTPYFEGFEERVEFSLGTRIDLGQKTLRAKRTIVSGNAVAERVNEETASVDRRGGVSVTIERTESVREVTVSTDVVDLPEQETVEPPTYTTISDEDGNYRFNDVPPGHYRIIGRYADAQTQSTGVVARGERTGVAAEDLVLRPLTGFFEIEGTANGQPSNLYTSTPNVKLKLSGFNATEMKIGQSSDGWATSCTYGPWRTYDALGEYVLPAEGRNTICVIYKNERGKETAPVLGTIVYDATPPANPFLLINNGQPYSKSTQLTVNLNAVDNLSGLASMQLSPWPDVTTAPVQPFVSAIVYPVSETNATVTLYARFIDRAGNPSDIVQASVVVDNIEPTGFGKAIWIAGDAAYATESFVNLTFAADGATEMMLSADPSFAGASWQPYAASTYWYLGTGDDVVRTVYVRFRDGAGNLSDVYADSVTLDTVAPQNPFVSINNGDTYANQVTVSLQLSAVSATLMQVSADGIFDAEPWETYATSLPWQLADKQGLQSVYMRFADDAGNVSGTVQGYIILDSVAPGNPTIRIDDGAEYTNHPDGDVSLSLSAVGAAAFRLSNIDCDSGSYELYGTSKEYSFPVVQGEHTLYVTYRDEAGNESVCVEDSIVLDTMIDVSGFSVAVTGPEGIDGKTASQTVWLTFSGRTTDMVDLQLSNDISFSGATWEPLVKNKRSWVLVLGDGTKTIHVRVRDMAGNVSDLVVDSIELIQTPSEPPTIQVADIDGDGFKLSQDSVELAWDISNRTHSLELQRFVEGVDSSFATIDTFTTATTQFTDTISRDNVGNIHHYRLRAFDDLGNKSQWSLDATALPFEPVSDAVWMRDSEGNFRFDFIVQPGTFSLTGSYTFEDVLGKVHTEALVENFSAFERPVDWGRYNEQFVVRTANAQNELIYETKIPLDIQVRQVVDDTGMRGTNSSLALDANGNTHILYSDDYTKYLMYATNASGAWVVSTVSSSIYFMDFENVSFAVDMSGTGHISYTWADELMYMTNASGVWVSGIVDTSIGTYSSIDVDPAGKARISYYSSQGLKYATNLSGTWVTTTVDTDGSASCLSSSIAFDSAGKGHISYCGQSGVLKYATNESGAWVLSSVDTEGSSTFVSLAVDAESKCHISYLNGNTALKYANNVTGVWSPNTVTSLSSLTGNISLGLDSTRNAYIGYAAGGKLMYATKASGSWQTKSVAVGNVGNYSSLAFDETGKAHFSYYNAETHNLEYITRRSADDILEKLVHGGTPTSIALDDSDKVHISYSQSDPTLSWPRVLYAYATNASGTWVQTTVDTIERSNIGSLALDANNTVHLSYYDRADLMLKYATNATGAWTLTSLGFAMMEQISIAVDGTGNAHISYNESGSLKYATNVSGTWVFETVMTTMSPEQFYSSIAVDVDGNAHISYFDGDIGLRYATDASGAWVFTTVDSSGFLSGQFTSLALDAAGKAHISYVDNSNWPEGDLRYATNKSGSWLVTIVDTAGDIDGETSINVDALGKAHISYGNQVDNSTIALYYATNASGAWLSKRLASTLSGAPIALNSTGNAHIINGPVHVTNFNGRISATTVRRVTTF